MRGRLLCAMINVRDLIAEDAARWLEDESDDPIDLGHPYDRTWLGAATDGLTEAGVAPRWMHRFHAMYVRRVVRETHRIFSRART